VRTVSQFCLAHPKAYWCAAGRDSDDGLETIREVEEQARRFRVEGVPFFIVNGKLTLSGARLPAAFIAAFNRTLPQSNRA
jgi:predicted DsbA family dithiol-disulfide isomerase